jgi:hypothetical protein
VTLRVTDNNTNAVNTQQLSDTNSFQITVNEVNTAPLLVMPTNQIVDEETLLSVSALGSDSDEPANALTFSLVSPPSGMTINATNGLIEWTPSEAQGPDTVTVTVVLTDENPDALSNQQLSVTNTFEITVNEINVAPVLTLPADQLYHAGTAIALNATATDADLPANGLTFELVSGPAGLNVLAGGGITWMPSDTQLGTNEVTVRVVDGGLPSLGDTNTFSLVIVSQPVLGVPTIVGTNVTLTWTAVSGTDYRLEYKGDLNEPNWSVLPGVISAATNTASANDALTTSNRLYRVEVLP